MAGFHRHEKSDASLAPDMTRAPPDSAEAWVKLGQDFIDAGQVHSAPPCFARATELEPRNPVHWARLGKVLLSLRQYEPALNALRQASAIDPRTAQWQTLLGYVAREQNDMDAALAAFARARQADPENLHGAVGEALLLPPIYRDMADLEHWRSRFEDGLARLLAEVPKHPSWGTQVRGLEWENFSLAHQGRDDRLLQEQYGRFIASLLASSLPDLQMPVERSIRQPGRIRVGFLSSWLYTCTIGHYFSSWILGLPRDQFDVRCYYTGHVRDELTAKLAAACDHFEFLGDALEAVAAHVRGDRPDVLIFTDIGLTPQSYLLANLRLAPIQCAAWGHPVTSGSRYIDHYFSCAAMEPSDAAAHYREKLVLLPGLGVCYARPPEPIARTRSHFGLPEDAHIYICPHRLHKLLPDWDGVLLDIMAQDPQAALVFFDGVAPGQRQAFTERLQQAMSARGIAPRRQIKFLPLLPHAEFRSALAIADVMLDTSNFSAGNAALDSLAVGLPIVAAEGRFMRGRQSAAMLRMVDVPELVAGDDHRYVELALRVAGNRAYRSSLSDRINAGLPQLFDRDEALATLAATLVGLVA